MKYIDNQMLLEQSLGDIQKSPWVAVDTEADSLHHYVEKLCLLQISLSEEDYIIDPLAALRLEGLLGMISEKEIIFHAADSDIRLLKKANPFKPQRIFDTLIAAQILGYPKMGLVDLAEKHCGLRLSKAEQKADWSRRPLGEKHLAYAANDTHYLKTIRDAMESELKGAGRLSWHTQHCKKLLETLEQPRAQESDASRAWQIKGSKELQGIALTFLRELWRWREKLAQEKDKPPFKILNSEYLVQIAKWAAEHPSEDVSLWKEAPRNVRGEHREAINGALHAAQTLPPAEYRYPERVKNKHRWTEIDSKILTALKITREKMAAELKIHPSLLATNAVLEAVVQEKPKNQQSLERLEMMLPWQIEIIGQELIKASAV